MSRRPADHSKYSARRRQILTRLWGLALVVSCLSAPTQAEEAEPPPRWNPLSFTVDGMALGGKVPLAGINGSAGWAFGTPRADYAESIRGWVFMPFADLSLARLYADICLAPSCTSQAFGVRFAGGFGLKVGWAKGFLNLETRDAKVGYGIAIAFSALPAVVRTDAQPLSPGMLFIDLVLRGRLIVGHPSGLFFVSVIVEGSVLDARTRGVNVGLSAGLSF